MDASMLIAWIVVAILAVCSIVLLAGRGSFLIAGYNTASKEDKRRYNVKRLCRVVGGGAGAIAAMLGIAAVYSFEMPPAVSWIIPWGVFGIVAVVMVLTGTICQKKPSK